MPVSLRGLSAWLFNRSYQDYSEAFWLISKLTVNEKIREGCKEEVKCLGCHEMGSHQFVFARSVFGPNPSVNEVKACSRKHREGGTHSHVCLNSWELADTVLQRGALLCKTAAH